MIIMIITIIITIITPKMTSKAFVRATRPSVYALLIVLKTHYTRKYIGLTVSSSLEGLNRTPEG